MVPICWATLHLLRLQTSIRERRIALCVWHTVWHSLSPALHDHSLSMNIIWRCWKLLFNQRWKARSGVTRLVSPGAATDGVTPIFPEKLTFLVIAVYKVYLFIPVVSLPIPPSTFRPRLSSVLSKFSQSFFLISFECHPRPWRVSPEAVRPTPQWCHWQHPFIVSAIMPPSTKLIRLTYLLTWCRFNTSTCLTHVLVQW